MNEMSRARRSVIRIGAVLLAALAMVVLALVVWKGPAWQMAAWKDSLSPRDALSIENELRRTVLLAVVALGVLLWVWLSWRRARAAEDTARSSAQVLAATEASRRTERLSKAIEQLAHHEPQVRVGAIYLLESLAREFEELHSPVIAVLAAYVRDRAAWEEDRPASSDADLQTVLTVLGRRRREHDRAGDVLDLRRTDLRALDLRGIDLRGACLAEAHLEDARLAGAQLESADLRGAHLERSDLVEANLRGANLREAHLEAAYLVDSHMEKADLAGAHLEGAYLGGAHLEGADLGNAHLDSTYVYGAHLEGASLHGARVVSTIGMARADREEIHRSGARSRRARGRISGRDDDERGGPARSGGAA